MRLQGCNISRKPHQIPYHWHPISLYYLRSGDFRHMCDGCLLITCNRHIRPHGLHRAMGKLHNEQQTHHATIADSQVALESVPRKRGAL